MCQCKCSQSNNCKCSQSCNNNNNGLRHLSIVTSTPCPNTNNGCGCGCGCGNNGSTQSSFRFCFLKSYLEDVLGWEDVVEPCSNYGRRCPGKGQWQNEGFDINNLFESLSSVIGDGNADRLSNILQNTKNTEHLKNFPPIDQNLKMQELISQVLNGNFEELEETLFQ